MHRRLLRSGLEIARLGYCIDVRSVSVIVFVVGSHSSLYLFLERIRLRLDVYIWFAFSMCIPSVSVFVT